MKQLENIINLVLRVPTKALYKKTCGSFCLFVLIVVIALIFVAESATIDNRN